jgi:uncharacterized protein YjbI with pentapeptide repeats
MTQDQIKEVLRLHKLWLNGESGGVRANLYDANLTGANLYAANLYAAKLSYAKGIIRMGPTSDKYEFFGVVGEGGVWIKAGCRWFTAEDARKHWNKTRKGTPLGDERIRFVDFIEAHFKAQGK